MKLHKIFIANRGEIAVRLMRAARELGWPSVALAAANEPDADHLRHADEIAISSKNGASAYLDAEDIVALAAAHGCTLLHPGYGFLSERAELARHCAQAGIGFVGPNAEILELFGSKAEARALAEACAIPVPMGSAVLGDAQDAIVAFRRIGSPMLLKAVAGGGGRGIRTITAEDQIPEAFSRCRSEAETWFGDGSLIAEALLENVRHVEVQILGDLHGDLRILGDRECSLQRRRQKLVEFAPAIGISAEQRRDLADAAERLGRKIGYSGLGTVEFLVSDHGFWFMEVNPRVQVEHTATEAALDLDLVQLQMRVAAGESLHALEVPDRPTPRHAAVQLRINSEVMQSDGSAQPAAGQIRALAWPLGKGVRIDTAIRQGSVQGLDYDALIGKLILSSPIGDYGGLIAKAYHALCETEIDGVETNLGFLRNLLKSGAVQSGTFDTQYIDRSIEALLAPMPHPSVARPANTAITERTETIEIPAGQVALLAENHSRVIELMFAQGDTVSAGQIIGLTEAMKMEFTLTSQTSGRIAKLLIAVGDVVKRGQVLCLIAPDGAVASKAAPEIALDLDAPRPDLARVLAANAALLDAARPEAVARRRKSGQRTARENIARLCDADSFLELGGLALAAQRGRRSPEDLQRLSPADGLITGTGRVNGANFGKLRARAAVMAYDYTVFAGTQGNIAHTKKHRLFALVERERLPLVMFAEGGGGRPGDTDDHGHLRLYNPTFWSVARLNALVPVIAVVAGRCFAGNAALAACAHVVIATRDAALGMGGPAMIEGGGLGQVDASEIGPSAVQAANGVVDLVVEDEDAAVDATQLILSYWQGSKSSGSAPDQRLLRHTVPQEPRRAYDMRSVIDLLGDEGSVIELGRAYGIGVVTALLRIEGRPLAVLANNAHHLSGALDADAARKSARFYKLAERLGLPVLKLCDTPGFMVGPEAEAEGLVRAAGDMFSAGAQYPLPQFTVIVRKCYGLGALAMVGGNAHAQSFTVAWPTGHFGKMGLEGQVRLGYRAEMEAIADPDARAQWLRERVAELYDRGDPLLAAGYVTIDAVIDPAATRDWINAALDGHDALHGAGRDHV